MRKFYDTESLRRELLEEMYAAAFSGCDDMLLDEDKIKNANEEELKVIARRYGYSV